MSQTLQLILPTKIFLYNRKKDNKNIFFRLNLNQYRNAHHAILHKSKTIFHQLVAGLLLEYDYTDIQFDKYVIEYQLTVANKRVLDANNIYSVVDKYFQDALVVNKVLENDDWKHNRGTLFLPARFDKTLQDHQILAIVKEVNV